MDVFEILRDLQFSFWQVLVIVVLLIFRREIRALVFRRFPRNDDGEMPHSVERAIVRELTELKENLLQTGDDSLESIEEAIDAKISLKGIRALLHIKKHTSKLWDKLFQLEPESEDFSCELRAFSFKEIQRDLDLLKAGHFLDYSVKPYYKLGHKKNWVLELHVKDIHPGFYELISFAKS